jgi:hypothetical protein
MEPQVSDPNLQQSLGDISDPNHSTHVVSTCNYSLWFLLKAFIKPWPRSIDCPKEPNLFWKTDVLPLFISRFISLISRAVSYCILICVSLVLITVSGQKFSINVRWIESAKWNLWRRSPRLKEESVTLEICPMPHPPLCLSGGGFQEYLWDPEPIQLLHLPSEVLAVKGLGGA